MSGLSVKLQLNQIVRIFQIKDGGGLLWSKPSAEIRHCDNTELKRSAKIFFSSSERHRWALVG